MATTTIFTPDDRRITVHGRHTRVESPLTGEWTSDTLFWTGSGIEFAADSREAYIHLRSDYDTLEQWITVELDGAQIIRVPVPRGVSRIPVMLGRESGRRSVIRVYKDVQPMRGDEASYLIVDGVELDGDLLEPPHRELKIEFIGDSITSGEGIIGPDGAPDWIPMWFSGSLGYPNLVSKALDADFRIVSQSGWGLITGYDNDPTHAVPLVYDKVCSVLRSEAQARLGSTEPYDFSKWQPDIVVVNLGTNDFGAMNNEPFTDSTGDIYKQEDTPEHHVEFSRQAEEFLARIRENNPSAHIIWLFGMFPTTLRDATKSAVERRNEDGDSRTHFFEVGQVTDDELGARWHPGIPAHSRVAKELTAEIKRILGK